MAGLKVTNMAAAIWPHLANPNVERRLPPRGGEAEWARSNKPLWAERPNDPLWSEPRPVPNGLDRVPGLVKIRKQER
jgi:hypothetical protein